ncbi:MAG: sensor histidine kinase [Solirubrobacteraceae bacterium]
MLADRGLSAAVQSLAQRSAAEVEVSAEAGGRLPPVVEAAAYFVVAESLTNVAKHAPQATARVAIERRGPTLFVEVADDGPGGADASGGGLTGLRQRVEALDGTLEVDSPAGAGTTIRMTLPCA